MRYNPKDHYFKKAKEEGFAARSVYKLQEIDQKLKIIKPGLKVLDLGAAPGSWSQWLSQKVGSNGIVIGLDLTEITIKLPNAHFHQADLLATDLPQFLQTHGYPEQMDLVVSDMAPKTTGIRDVDQARSHELCEMAFHVATQVLRPGGNFVCKYFQSGEYNRFRDSLRKRFKKIEVIKPDSTRTRSFEIFLAGVGFS